MAKEQKSTENEFQKARILFDKGISEYNNNNHNKVNEFP
jgi:hypothetical protein